MRRLLSAALVLGALATACSGPEPRPLVLLVAIDGWRWDYLDRYEAPAIRALAERGVRSEGLIPVFPSLTFPNHYTQVTGLRPARHGIVSNSMIDPEIPGRFTLSNREVLADPRWWDGEPIWNTAERQGRRAAPLFWPGSEVAIGGRRPSFWLPYDDDLPNARRVDQLLEWLQRPEAERPGFLTLYFSDVDTAGHDFGPESSEVREAVARVDAEIGRLVAGVERIGLADSMHYVLVSDHGMTPLSPDRVIYLDDYIDLASVDIVNRSPLVTLDPRSGDVEALMAALAGKHPSLAVYRREELPDEYGLRGHPRLQAVVGLADNGWYISSRDRTRVPGGAHGYDPRLRVMHGLFVAAGPRLKSGMRVPAFESLHVYELLCALLGVEPAPNDGDPDVTRRILR
jgi:predicted AlkP superfamily pyrophosphatase or phosphodiesterase